MPTSSGKARPVREGSRRHIAAPAQPIMTGGSGTARHDVVVPGPARSSSTRSRSVADDPRFQKVRQKLIGAVVELGREGSVDAVTISQLASRAGVARQTVYKHTPSAPALLAEYLDTQLGEYIEDLAKLVTVPGSHPRAELQRIYGELMECVSRDADLYAHVFAAEGASTTLAALMRLAEPRMGAYVRQFAGQLSEPPTALWVEMAAAQQLFNVVAMIRAWIRTGGEAGDSAAVDAYLTLAPPWQLARLDGARDLPGRLYQRESRR
ncbi:TetR/AcrR family transcriptional regulator [Neoactinobaculum massilliense]|uniref:TetR/AcrR family transcriptional regulator n=1 Tax=Neoactinobaculum massilliense TaxID=2364794 RepID=UPI000F52874F|nr:TetR/AcrR family transcriptional regulator [Neoactinobaculum massilliense]